MKTDADFLEFYERELAPKLIRLERMRHAIIPLISILFIIIGCVLVYLSLKYQVYRDDSFIGALMWYLLLVLADYSICKSAFIHLGAKFICRYKEEVVSSVAAYAHDGLEYSKDEGINSEVICKSRVFLQDPDTVRSEDCFSGVIGETEVAFSEVYAGFSGITGRVPFAGVIFVADFNKHFRGLTLVLPRGIQKVFGERIGQIMQSTGSTRPPVVRLEDINFEREFIVYSDDQVEARYILSPALMERIRRMNLEYSKGVALSFWQDKLVARIEYDYPHANFFEPDLLGDYYSRLLRDFKLLQSLVSIVKELNLNTRIWSKE
jgi:hypothetical protein